MNRKRITSIFGVLLSISLVLAACQPVTTTVEVVKTVEVPVEKQVEVVKTQEVNIIETQVVEVARRAFSTPNPILSDLRVRQALSYCTNKAELLQAVYPLLTDEERSPLVMNTNIPRSHWAYAGDENVTIYPFDPEKGKALLEEAGWTQDPNNDFRTDANGDELSLKFTTTTATFRQIWAAVWEQQMADCGIRIVRLHAPASWWFGGTTGLQHRDFELGAYAWVGAADPAGQTLYACDQIPLPENNWVGQNYMGWCNEIASNAIKQANNTLIRQERIDAYRTFQEEFTKDVPSISLFNRTDTYAISPDLQGFAPAPGQQPLVTYNVADWEIPGRDTIVYGFTQEPASLFTLVEGALNVILAASLIQGFAYTSLDYDYAPLIQTPLATLENNLAVNNDVEAKAGDKVVDANGEIVDLKSGMMVKNAAGESIEFDGSPIMMKQLVVQYKFRDDLVWSDGTPVSQEDYELKLKIDCDPESGATSFILCDQMQDVEYASNGYTITWLPGVQNPLYFLSFDNAGLPDIYPAHRELSDGRKLADVPASEWATLPEIAEDPIGVGPYVLTGWVKGEKMTFEVNPYYYGGTPKTKKIVISFITPENAEAQLLGGQVDILGDLVGVTETLKNASDQGTVKVVINPSDTWEHIDMNLFLQ